MNLREEIELLISECYTEDITWLTKQILSKIEKTINIKILELKKKDCCVKENPTAHDIALHELSDLKLEMLK